MSGAHTGNAAALVACKQGFKAPQARADVPLGSQDRSKVRVGLESGPAGAALPAFPEC